MEGIGRFGRPPVPKIKNMEALAYRWGSVKRKVKAVKGLTRKMVGGFERALVYYLDSSVGKVRGRGTFEVCANLKRTFFLRGNLQLSNAQLLPVALFSNSVWV